MSRSEEADVSRDVPLQFAVVGSGPAGCFLAQSILRALPDARLTVFDRLPSPYGLVRYGVAADHQHTKSITRQFERLFSNPQVRFAGNLEVGLDVELTALEEAYDAVVLATGLAGDRGIEIPGAGLPGVYGSGALTRVLNSHPGERPELPPLGTDVVIIGGGNVAIDILRFLVKDRDGYADSDIADHALDSYLQQPAERVTLLNRSAPAMAKSDPQMLKELSALPRARYRVPELGATAAIEEDRTATARLAALAELASPERASHPGPDVDLRFGATPVRILGDDRVTGVEISVDGQVERVAATSVITAIGFVSADEFLPRLLSRHSSPASAETGRIAPGLYRTGWAKRGPRGAIPENRACAKGVADEIVADLDAGALAPSGARGFDALPDAIRDQAISYDQWLHLDAHERELARPGRVRRKLTDRRAMIDIARQGNPSERNAEQ